MTPLVAAGLSIVMLALHALLAIRPVTVDVTPHVAFAPASVRVTVRVEPNPENRYLIVEANAGDSYRRSDVPLEGEQAPITNTIEWRALSGGEYDVVASVVSKTRLLGQARTHLTVIGLGE